MTAKNERILAVVLIAAAALVGMALVLYATSSGPGVGGDATIYLISAQNFLEGKGLGWVEADGSFRLLPYTPPFYPLALSAVGLLTDDLTAGARWLNVLLLGLLAALTGAVFYRATQRLWLSVVLSGLAAVSPVLIGVSVWAMSEPLFLLLGFASLFLLLEYFHRPRAAVLLVSALLAGLAFLTRYIGLAFVATGGLALLLFGEDGDCRIRLNLNGVRIKRALLYGAAAVLPVVIWMAIDIAVTGTVGSRSGQPAAAYWERFVAIGPALQEIVLFWLLPDSVTARLPGAAQTALWLISLAGLVGLSLVLARRTAPARSARLAELAGLFAVVYLIVLAGVQVLTYPPITLASRMLSPVHLAVLVLLAAFGHLGLATFAPRSRLAAAGVLVVGLGLLGTYALRSALIARDYHQTGIGYNAAAWRDSSTIAMTRELPEHVPLISNETTAIMYLTGRSAYALQEIYLDHPLETFSAYGEGDDEAQRVFREEGGALVLFAGNLEDDFAMYGDQAQKRISALKLGLYCYYQGEDGAIFFKLPPLFTSSEPCR